MAVTRTSEGLIFASDGSLTDWSGDTQWTSAADPQFVCYPIPRVLLQASESYDDQGVREGQLFIDDDVDATWWLVYDAGDGVTGWRAFLASSDDKGKTWTKHGAFGMNLNKVSSGTWAAYANGWLEKRGSTYYYHRVTTAATFGSPDVGLPSIPYRWDCWQNATLGVSGWTAAPNVPVGDQYYALSGAAASEFLPGSVVESAGTYYGFAQMNSGSGGITIGIANGGANPDGPFIAPATAILTNASTGMGSRNPENPKVFYSSTLGRYALLSNLIAIAGTHTDANAISYSTSLTDWSGQVTRQTQGLGPMDSTDGLALGLACHTTEAEGVLVEGASGFLPVVYDTNPVEFTPGWHHGRKIRGAVLEPTTHALHINQSNTTVYEIRRSAAHTDIVIEAAICILARTDAGWHLALEYRSDSTGDNCYQVGTYGDASGLTLKKVASGSVSTLATTSGTLVNLQYRLHRIKITVVGNLHTIYFDGEEQISHTDNSSPIASGTTLGLSGKSVQADVRRLSARTSDTVTIDGLTSGDVVDLRSFGLLPVDTQTADVSGIATFTATHWPHYGLDVDGTLEYSDAAGVWGGDVFTADAVATEGDLLLETGDHLLLETGDIFLLEYEETPTIFYGVFDVDLVPHAWF